MKKLKRVLAAVAVMLLCQSIFVLPASADDTKALAEAKKGVVQLLTIVYDNIMREGEPIDACTGTGFAVGTAGKDSNIFVTNWHVVTCDGYAPQQVRVYLLLDEWYFDGRLVPQNAVECEILYSSADTGGNPDYAILRATEAVSGFKALPLRASEDVASGTRVYALGYPGTMTDLNSGTGSGIDDITITSGVVSQRMKMQITENSTVDVVVHDAQISGGNSGGPLIDSDGYVVGVNTYSHAQLSYSVAIDTRYVVERMDLLNLPYTLKASGMNWMILGGAAVFVVVCAAVVFLLLRKRKIANTIWLKAPDGSLTPITKTAILVGRDPACQVRLPENTKAVSRRHCTLQAANGMVILTDVGSSFGTFVGDTKLEINRPVTLGRGSAFWLGSKNNYFTIC